MDAELFRKCLSKLTFYRPDDEVHAVRSSRGALCAGYNVNIKGQLRRREIDRPPAIAEASIQVELPICYIIRVEVAQEFWRKGYGKQLLGCIADFALQCKCDKLVTTPSGMGRLFWPAMGFKPEPDQVQAFKILEAPHG